MAQACNLSMIDSIGKVLSYLLFPMCYGLINLVVAPFSCSLNWQLISGYRDAGKCSRAPKNPSRASSQILTDENARLIYVTENTVEYFRFMICTYLLTYVAIIYFSFWKI